MSLYLTKLLLFLLWVPCIVAAPSGIQKRSFKVDRIRNPNFKRHNGPKELLRSYRKYRMPIPQDLLDALEDEPANALLPESPPSHGSKTMKVTEVDAIAQTTVGLVPAIPANGGIEYISPITIGGQTINVALDTGSADLWVFSSQLPGSAQVGHQTYNPLLSPTFRHMPSANFSIIYGDGTSASGNVGIDVVDVGGATVTNQAVQMATAVSPVFVLDMNLSGLVGLGFSQLSTVKPVKQKTFFENIMPTLFQPLFTVDLRKDTASAYEFGIIDSSKFRGTLSWIPAYTRKGFWQLSSGGFAVGSLQKKLPVAQVIIDTGTTLMLVSEELANGYYSQVPGAKNTLAAGGTTFPCNTTLPDLLLDISPGYTARVRGEDINFGAFEGDECFGGIQRTASHFQIWGDIFFRSQFVVFHGGNHSLGMAPHT
ncbi:aspartic peptidase domain-containing protein [Corynascus novoguineensis]|uniref:Aspartic peptidase domain-containing protein n=1 Tax=Corynascus novoguineensis TaxID=1126955 RepID=A0AAN7HM01_9PEZI|nr:aspartic peptidase domain-containing protein [Corynascus novoguineensis]